MNKKHLLIWSICALSLTISAAFVTSKSPQSSVVRAQGGGGCWQNLPTHEVSCGCEGVSGPGTATVANPGAATGTGQTSALSSQVTCTVGTESCSGLSFLPGFDIACAVPTPTPFPCEPPTESGGVKSCPAGKSYNLTTGQCCPGDGGCNINGITSGCFYKVGEYCTCKEYYAHWDPGNCSCDWNSPVVVDVLGNGFNLTDAANGVDFDIGGCGAPKRLGWTSGGSDDAWLGLDNNGNGQIDDGTELFGNFTAQPAPPEGEERNGFLALAQFDTPAGGGNSDGLITKKDSVFNSLRLWQDVNHNGVSEAGELFTLPQLGLRKIHLDYHESDRVDEHGNRFKYRAKVKDAHDAQFGRWAWDVFLVSQ